MTEPFRLAGPLNRGLSSWMRTYVGDTYSGLELLGVGSMPKPGSRLSLDLSSLLGPLFYTW